MWKSIAKKTNLYSNVDTVFIFKLQYSKGYSPSGSLACLYLASLNWLIESKLRCGQSSVVPYISTLSAK